jgi:hypothetical protein
LELEEGEEDDEVREDVEEIEEIRGREGENPDRLRGKMFIIDKSCGLGKMGCFLDTSEWGILLLSKAALRMSS